MPWSIFTQGGGQGAAVTWAEDLLTDIGAPLTEGNKQFIYDWEVSEGGGGKFNPLNQGPVPGHADLTSTGQQYGGGAADFVSWGAGLSGARDYLNMPAYSAIKDALRNNDPQQARTLLWGSPWAASHYGYGSAFSDSPLPGKASALGPGGGSAKIGGNTGGGSSSGGGIGAWASSIWTGLGVGLEQSPEFSGAGQAALDPAQAIAGLTAPFVKIAAAVDWFMQPSHWMRIFCGIGGTILLGIGVWNISHVGGQASSVTVQGTSIPTSAGGTMALPLGILEVGLGGALLFVAFHNLPSTVKTLPDFLSYLQQEIHRTPTKAPAPQAVAS